MAVVEGTRRRSDVGATTHDLYRQYGRQIYAYCFHRLRSREEAEDAVQTTFMNAFRALQRGAQTQFEQAWLFKIAQNVCIARSSSSARRLRLEAPNDFEVLEEIVPAQGGERPLELIGVEEALEAMPENQRRAILLREWQGLSYREIGEELQLSQPAVEMLIFRARRALAGALEQPAEKKRNVGRKVGSLGSLLGALKTLLGGGAAIKAAAVAAAAIAVVGESAQHTIVHNGAKAHRSSVGTAATVVVAEPSRGQTSVAAPRTQRRFVAARRHAAPLAAHLPAVQGAPPSLRPEEGAHAPAAAPPVTTVAAPPVTTAAPAPTVTTTAAAPAAPPVSEPAPAPAPPADHGKPVASETQPTTTTTTTTSATPTSDPQAQHGNDGQHGHQGHGHDHAPPLETTLSVTTPPVTTSTATTSTATTPTATTPAAPAATVPTVTVAPAPAPPPAAPPGPGHGHDGGNGNGKHGGA